MRSLLVPILTLCGCVDADPDVAPPDSDLCAIVPSTAMPRFAVAPSVIGFAHEPIAVTVGWTDACSQALCYLAEGAHVCAPPSSTEATVTVDGAAVVTPHGPVWTDAAGEAGAFHTFAVMPAAAGTVTIHAVASDDDLTTPFSSEQPVRVVALDDIALQCRLGTEQAGAQPCGDAVPAGMPFIVTFSGVAGGSLYDIPAARLTFTGAKPTCAGDVCTFASGSTAPVAVSAEFGGVTATLAIAID